ncbi:hypothetical protein KEM52_000938 [Ascosphaera acerosa]|nr:hypothetical protein KEM52_000938 [Ascosphaera acerosa]
MEKKGIKRSKTIAHHEAVGFSTTWKQGFWKRFPWLGMSCLLFVILCLVFNIVILVVSDGMVVNKWGIQPAVLIAISTALSNGILRIALMQGGMITWWRHAMNGCSIDRLSALWVMYNENPFKFFKSFHILGLAMVAVVVAPVDSPLFQRAQTVETRTAPTVQPLQVSIAEQMPLGYTGNMRFQMIPTLESMTDQFRQVYLGYESRQPMYIETPGHPHANFSADIDAAGFRISCTQRSEVKNFGWTYLIGRNGSANMDNVTAHGYSGIHGPLETLFDTKLAWSLQQPSQIKLTAMWKQDSDCVAPLQVKECTYSLATLRYPVDVQQGRVSLDSASLDSIGVDNKSVADYYSYDKPELSSNSTLGGIYLVGTELFSSHAKIYQAGNLRSLTIDTNGTLVQQAANNLANVTSTDMGYNACNVTFQDPTHLITSALQELMFRTALAASNDTRPLWRGDNRAPVSTRQTAQANLRETQAIFKLHPNFLGGAAAVAFVCMVPVAMTLWGFWELGQKPTMNPIALSRAFGSPLLEDTDEGVINADGKVKYGLERVPSPALSSASSAAGDDAEGNLTRAATLRPRFTFVKDDA